MLYMYIFFFIVVCFIPIKLRPCILYFIHIQVLVIYGEKVLKLYPLKKNKNRIQILTKKNDKSQESKSRS